MRRGILATFLFAGALPLAAASVETQNVFLSGEDALHPRAWEIEMATGPRANRGLEPIPVPANWELVGFGDFTYGHDEHTAVDRGRYRLRFAAEPSWTGRAIDLVFEGVMTDATVELDGVPVGQPHLGGYTEFRYDVTHLIRPGAEHVLTVAVAERSADESVNLAEREADYWVFGGIYRPVRLEIHPLAHLGYVSIDARHDGSIAVEAQLSGLDDGPASVEVELLDGGNLTASAPVDPADRGGRRQARLSARAAGVLPWSAEEPHLATLEIRLLRGSEVVHRRRERIGFRTLKFTDRGFFLNERRIFLKGVNRHDSWPATGRAITRERAFADAELIRSLGFNAVRTAHYPPSRAFLEACDQLGLYVVDELPGWHDPYDNGVGTALVVEMVRRDGNHPSIVAWANGNEGGWNLELIDEFERHDRQLRPVLLPDTIHRRLDTQHYPAWGELVARLAGNRWAGGEHWAERSRRLLRPPAQVLPTEMLHGLWDGGGGASLADYFDLLRHSPRGAGFFLWAFADESVQRNLELDSAGNLAPDGIVGPWREWEASAFAVRDILRPIVAAAPPTDGVLRLENRFDATDLETLTAHWRWLALPDARAQLRTERELGVGEGRASSTAPGGTGELAVGSVAEANVLEVRFTRPIDGREVASQRIALAPPSRPRIMLGAGTATRDGATLVLRAGDSEARLDARSGELLSLRTGGRALRLVGGTRRADGETGRVATTKLGSLKLGAPARAEFAFEAASPLRHATWQLSPEGRLHFSWIGERRPGAPWDGLRFELPGAVTDLEWVGEGPCPVWRNRRAGGGLGAWRQPQASLGLGCNQARGFFLPRWMRLQFETEFETETEPAVLLVEAEAGLAVGVDAPSFPAGSKSAVAELPPRGGLTLLHELPAIGDKFDPPEDLGPSAAASSVEGNFRGSVVLSLPIFR